MVTSKSFDTTNPETVSRDEEEDDFVEVAVNASPIREVQEMDRGIARKEDDPRAIMMGACAAGACLGCLVGGGPVWACAVGAGSAWGTTLEEVQHDDDSNISSNNSPGCCLSSAGTCTRSMGRLTLSCCEKAIRINEKHRVLENAQHAASTCWIKSKDMNERHKMVERAKGCLAASWEGTKEANRKYRLVDRTFQGIGFAITYVNEQIVGEAPEGNSTAATNVPEQEGTAVAVYKPDQDDENSSQELGISKKGPYSAVQTTEM